MVVLPLIYLMKSYTFAPTATYLCYVINIAKGNYIKHMETGLHSLFCQCLELKIIG